MIPIEYHEEAQKIVLATLLNLSKKDSGVYQSVTVLDRNIPRKGNSYFNITCGDISSLLGDYISQDLVITIGIRQSTGGLSRGYLANLERIEELEKILGNS